MANETAEQTSAGQSEGGGVPGPVWRSIIPEAKAERGRPPAHALEVAPEDSKYQLIDRPEPPPVPNGWYVVTGSDRLAIGEIYSFIAVERELVAYRGSDGQTHVVDAHCPHMGAHLGGGAVEENNIACPYHGWKFSGDGQCVEVPYNDSRIPSKACVPSYPTIERNGLISFWYHRSKAAPNIEIPELEEHSLQGWSAPHVYETEFVASLQDMGENNVDYTHFQFVHGRDALDASTSQFTTDGPYSTVVERFEEDDLTFVRNTWGPGLALLRIPNLTTVLTSTTPIDRRHVRLYWHFYFPVEMESLADEIISGVVGEHGLGADQPIWKDKIYRDKPLLVKGDGPIKEFRRWYSQFYEE